MLRLLRTCGAVAAIVAAVAIVMCPRSVVAQGSIMFDTRGVSDKPQSKLWIHADSWWGCLNNSTNLAIYKLVGGTWVHKLNLQAAIVPFERGGTCDVLWDGTHVFVAAYGSATSNIYKLGYDEMNDTYTLLPGFPVSISMLAGSETIVLAKDSIGRLWATYEAGGQVRVVWTTSGDHTQWIATPHVLSGTVIADDISTIVSFGGNKTGVLWTDQNTWKTSFRWRNDIDAPTSWSTTETVRSGFGCVDDHINITADSQGRVYFVSKDIFDAVWVGRRDPDGTWTVTTGASGLDCGTRPILQIDEASNKMYVFYTRWVGCSNLGNHSVEERVADLDAMLFSLPVVVIGQSGVAMNEPQGTKQLLPAGSLAIVCEGNGKAYWRGWGPVSGIGGSDPGGAFPPPAAPPGDLTAQSATESPQTRMLLWRLDASSGGTAADASGNNRTGTLGSGLAAPNWTSGVTGNGLFFDGDAVVTAGGSPFAFINQSFTLETWFKIDETTSAQSGTLFHRGDLLHNNFTFGINEPFVEFGWSTGDTTDTSVKATVDLRDGAWHHLAAVWDNAALRARLFVDGQQRASVITTGPVYSNAWNLYVGAKPDIIGVDDGLKGTLDLVAISNTALYSSTFTPPFLYPASTTRYVRVSWSASSSVAGVAGYRIQRTVNGGVPAQLTALTPNVWYADLMPLDGQLAYGAQTVDGLMQVGAPGWTTVAYESNPPAVPAAPQNVSWTELTAPVDMAAYWEFDEPAGAVALDGTELGRDARLGGAASGDAAEPARVATPFARGLSFDGSSDYCEVADDASLRFQGSFTAEAWFRTNGSNDAQAILAKDEGSSKRNYLILLLQDGRIEFTWRDGSSTRRVTSSTTITDNAWHHVACVFDVVAHLSHIYIDGNPAGSGGTNGTPYNGPEPLRFGARGSSSGGGALSDLFDGEIDLVRVGAGVRYTGPFTPPDLLRGGAKRKIVSVAWSVPASGLVADYRFYRQLLPSGSNQLLATLPATQTQYVDATAVTGLAYRYTVRARNSNGNEGSASAPLDVTIPEPTDALGDDRPPQPRLATRVEPNPFNPQSMVVFATERPGPVVVELFDARGRRVHRIVHANLPAGVHRVPIVPPGGRATQLASGVYFVRVRADGRDERVKAVLVR